MENYPSFELLWVKHQGSFQLIEVDSPTARKETSQLFFTIFQSIINKILEEGFKNQSSSRYFRSVMKFN